ncbi:MAG: UDP-N-acetylmuramoyl-tripeptide--D-alanyl-D-alanine ligase [Clostridia bacterium]|nr:UDP-N-acetylmuramoyl-tripeptide--D-alanyl-D-alanine ligase [Clostridia bacterium]
MNIYLLLSLIFSSIGCLFAITRQFQMFQQNSYYPSRYFKWLETSFNGGFLLSAILYFAVSVLYHFKLYIPQCIVSFVLLCYFLKTAIKLQKTSVKGLVFTDRIKRLYLAAALVLVLLIAVYAFLPKGVIGRIAVVICLLLAYITPVFTFALWGITLPIEKRISQYYIDDAKKILATRPDLTVIGVTGSYGKTTTKFILTRILSEKFNVVCTPHSFNTPMGIVKTIRTMLKPQTEIFVCEMGAKEVGNIKEDCDIASPHYGIITSVGPQHLETFKSIENVFSTKFELADAVRENGGITFVNGDSKEIINRIDGEYKIYGTDKKFDFCGEKLSYGRNGSEFTIKLGTKKVKFTTRLLGLHSIIDTIGAIALAYTLGVEIPDIQYAVASLKPTEHRLEMKPFTNGSLLIDDAYNSNPEGCLEAVRVLGSFDGMQKVIVTPGLVELGDKEYECNYALGKEAALNCDKIILVGTNRSKPMADAVRDSDFDTQNLYIAANFKEAMDIYSSFADSNTAVLFENDLPDNYLY